MDLDDFNSLWKAIKPDYDKKKGKYIKENKYRMTAIKVFTLITKELNLFEGQAISNQDCFVFTGKIMELIENLEKSFYPSSTKKIRCIVCGRLNTKITCCECNQELVLKYRALFKRFDNYIVALYQLGISHGTSRLYCRAIEAFLNQIDTLLNSKKESEKREKLVKRFHKPLPLPKFNLNLKDKSHPEDLIEDNNPVKGLMLSIDEIKKSNQILQETNLYIETNTREYILALENLISEITNKPFDEQLGFQGKKRALMALRVHCGIDLSKGE